MSSNPYHNNFIITRSNYEEYFLLYVDDELTAEEKAAVDEFLLLNPDLHQELELLLQTKLPLEMVPIEEKESLLSANMKAKELDEALLLYLDNELSEEEKRQVEENLENDAAYRLQYELLLKTRSDADEKVVCPFKEELYRREERKIPVLWWRVAAAVLVVASMATFILTFRNQPDTIATRPAEEQSQSSTNKDIKRPAHVQPAKEIAVEKTSRPTENNSEDVAIVSRQNKEERETVKKPNKVRLQTAPVEEETIVVNMRPRLNDVPVLMPEKVEPVRKPLTKEPVTSEPLYTYNSTDAPVNTVPAVADETEKSRSSLKGLLRKAARNVERRTNIKVTNENDELLIGAMAISLK